MCPILVLKLACRARMMSISISGRYHQQEITGTRRQTRNAAANVSAKTIFLPELQGGFRIFWTVAN